MKTIELTNIPTGKEFNAAIRRSASALASTQTGLRIHKLFNPHHVDTETGEHGIRGAIRRILTQAGCIAPRHTGELEGENRKAYIAKAMLADNIIAAYRGMGMPAADRYPDQTVRQVLSHDFYHDGTVGKFEAKQGEFERRPGGAPNFYYLIEAEEQPA